MKKFYLFIALLAIPFLILGQNKNEITIGNGTSTSFNTPWNTYYNYSYSQLIYTADEIGIGSGGAIITSIKFYYNGYDDYTWDNLLIFMDNNSKSTFSSTSDWVSIGDMTQVFNGSVVVSDVAGWVTITLDNAFLYNGTDNLIIAIDNNNGDYLSSSSKFQYTSTSSTGYQTLYYRSDGTNPNPENPNTGTRDYSRSNIKINYIVDADPMEYSSSTTSTASTSDALLGSTDNEIIKLKVETTGYLSPIAVTSINFNTTGSTSDSDISNAKVFVTTADEFSATNQFGSTISSPSGNLTFTGSANLGNGNTYFWLTYDIASGATLENVVDGQCISVTVDGTPRAPTVTNPSGTRTIDALKYAGGSGTEGDPYRISRLKDLREFCQAGTEWGGTNGYPYYVLTNNINAAATQYWDDSDDDSDGDKYNDPNDGTSSGNNEGWPAVGNAWGWNTWFVADFNGQGYEIDGLYMNRDNSLSYAGFFGVLYTSANIANVGLTNINFTSNSNYLGGLCGESGIDLINNCYTTGNIYSTGAGSIGGIVARVQGQTYDNHISNSYSTCDINYTGSGSPNMGGFAGYVQKVTGGDTKIYQCFSTGDVTNISSGSMTGGFVGRLASGTIENCFYIGEVTGHSGWSGCFDAYCDGTVNNCYTVSSFYYNNGTPDPTNKGFRNGGTNNDNFWDSDASNQVTATGADAKTTYEMKIQSTFTDAGWDFSSIWTIDPSVNDGYPYLIGMEPPLPTIIWDGSSSDDWNTAANWNGDAIPTSGDNVIIQNSGGAQPNIESGETADCYNLTVYSDATLTIESGGSIITSGNITNSGTITIEHTMADGKWHLVSSPVYTKAGYIFEGDYLQYYNETLPSNNYIEISDGNTYLGACKGYAWRNNSEKSDFTFSGSPFTGNQSVATTSEQLKGWNLVGNPYPSSLDWNLLDNTYGTVYTFVDNGANNGWRSYNDGAIVNGGVRYIAPMQGFFIATETTGVNSFAVSNSDRTHDGANGYVKSENQLSNYIKLKVVCSDKMDETFIQFGNQYVMGFDPLYDAWKMNSESSESLLLFTKTIDGDLCIDRRPNVNNIQLGFKNPDNANAVISIVENKGLSAIELEDTKLNKFHKLTSEAYSFNWQTTDSEERFILHLKATGLEDLEEQEAQVYAAHGQVYVRLDEPSNYQEISFYDLAGRVIMESNLSNQSLQNYDLGTYKGALLVQLKGKVKTKTKKVVL